MSHRRILRVAIALLACAAMPAAPAAAPARLPPALDPPSEAPVNPDIPVVLLVDLSSGQTLFARDAERRFVPASVTKVMTAYTAFRLIESGKLSVDTPVVVSQEIADAWSGEGSSMFLQAGDRVTVGQLLLGVTTVSANDGSVVLATHAAGSEDKWLAMMNANARELGMRNTHFGTPNGWPDEGRTYTSAHDLAVLAEALTTRFPGLYKRYFGNHGLTYRNITQANHDPITGVVDGADGMKTGYTRQSGYNFLGSAQRGSRRLVLVIGAAPNVPARNQTARDLMRWGFDAFDSQQVLPAGTELGAAFVQNGSQDEVRLRTEGEVLASVPHGSTADVTLSLRYRGPVEAPIEQGQQVAWLRVAIPGQEPHDVPLVAAEAVPRANLLQRLVNGVAALLT